MKKLLPCPFCGEKARYAKSKLVKPLVTAECSKCGVNCNYWGNKELALAFWNTRASLSAKLDLAEKESFTKDEVKNLIQTIYSEFAELEMAHKTTFSLRMIIEQEIEQHPLKPIEIFVKN